MIDFPTGLMTAARARVATWIGARIEPEPHFAVALEEALPSVVHGIQRVREDLQHPHSAEPEPSWEPSPAWQRHVEQEPASAYDAFELGELAEATDRLGDPWKAACEVFGDGSG